METDGFPAVTKRRRSVLYYRSGRRLLLLLLMASVAGLALYGAWRVTHGDPGAPTRVWRALIEPAAVVGLFVAVAAAAAVVMLHLLWQLVVRRGAALIADRRGIKLVQPYPRRIAWQRIARLSIIFVGPVQRTRAVLRINRVGAAAGIDYPLRGIRGGIVAAQRWLAHAESIGADVGHGRGRHP